MNNPIVRTASFLLHRQLRKLFAMLVESRASEHIFYTFYRMNTVRSIKRVTRATPGLGVRAVVPFSSYPFARRPSWLTSLECLWIRLVVRGPARGLASNLVGDMERMAGDASSTVLGSTSAAAK